MARGLLSGLVWGGVVSVVALAGLSVATDPPEMPDAVAGADVPVEREPVSAVEADPEGSPSEADMEPSEDVVAGGADEPAGEDAAPGDTDMEPVAPVPAASGETEGAETDEAASEAEMPARQSAQGEADAGQAGSETEELADVSESEPGEGDVPDTATETESAEVEPDLSDSGEPEDTAAAGDTQDTPVARPQPARRPSVVAPPEVSTDTPAMTAPESEDGSPLTSEDTTPGMQPETGGTDVALAEPGEGQAEGGVEVGSDTPVRSSDAGGQPAAPTGEEDLSISTEPAQPVAPDVPEEESPFAEGDAEVPPPEMPAVTSGTGSEAADEVDVAAGDVESQPDGEEESTPDSEMAAAGGADTVDPAEPRTADAEEAAPEAAGDAPAEAPNDEAAVDAEESAQGDGGASAEEPGEMRPEAEDDAPVMDFADVGSDGSGEDRPGLGRPAGDLTELAPDVQIGRLPTVTGAPDAAPDAPAVADAAPEPDGAEGEDAPAEVKPLEAFAEPVEVEEGKPRMSIVLIDDGRSPIGTEALDAFPYPLTFAVDTAWEGATQAMRAYRARGFEVVALADLPEGARPADAEVSLQTLLGRVPEAVAVMETDDNGLSRTRQLSEQVAAILSASGHGLILFPKGLNTAEAMAEKAGVRAATVFRDFDAEGESPTVIRRFLDQAAFRAGQEGGVIMVGRIRADTISALLLWGLQDKAGRVALVPVSQVLTGE